MTKLHLILVLFLLTPITHWAQYCEPEIEIDRNEVDTTITNVKEYFLHGHINGHLRNYFMTTYNVGHLDDHYAYALGGALEYSTAHWKGFHFGVKGIFTYNMTSSKLDGDTSVLPASWEMELFDVLHPANKKDLDRLEELYMEYNHERVEFKIGKIDIDEGPLLKRRDGRMKPYVYRGIWSDILLGKKKKTHLYTGGINGVSPRGMTEWFSLNEAIGLLDNGLLNDSTEYEYHEKSGTKGLVVNGIKTDFKERLKLQVWNYYLHRIYNTTWLQMEYDFDHFGAGVQYAFQVSDPHQSTLAEYERYFDEDHQSHTIAGQVYYKFNDKVRFRIAHLESLGEGRFSYPKELSRDDFYTSISRARFDGYGDANVSLAEVAFRPLKKHNEALTVMAQFQNANNSHHHSYQHNKYETPDYNQFNLSAKYNFQGKLEGVHLNLLYVYRHSDIPEDMEYYQQYYRTNLHHFNVVLDVVF